MALTVETRFKNSPWGCHLQRGAQPRAAGKSLLFCAGFPSLSPVICAIYYKQHSKVAPCTFSALAGEPGSPRSAWGPRRGRVCTRRNEQHSPLPGWEIRGRPPPGAGGTASALVAPPAAPANAALGRSPRRQESTGVTHASRRPRRRSRRRPPWRSAQRAAATPSTKGGRLLRPLFSGIRS